MYYIFNLNEGEPVRKSGLTRVWRSKEGAEAYLCEDDNACFMVVHEIPFDYFETIQWDKYEELTEVAHDQK